MSYYDTSSSTNTTLTFISYNSENLQHGLNPGIASSGKPMRRSQTRYKRPVSSNRQVFHEAHTLHKGHSCCSLEDSTGGAQGEVMDGGEETKSPDSELSMEDNRKSIQTKKDRRNKPGQKFGAKKRSWVWSWFIQDKNDQNIAVCDFCGKIITRVASDRGSPKKLSEHLHTHKLTKSSMNTARALHVDENGMQFNNANVRVPFGDPFEQQEDNRSESRRIGVFSQNHIKRETTIAQSLQVQAPQRELSHNPRLLPQATQDIQHVTDSELIAPELKQDLKKYRRLNNLLDPNAQNQRCFIQAQTRPTSQVFGNAKSNIEGNCGYLPLDFESSPYSEAKFHRHLIKFLVENKLSVQLIRSHSFQQLIYDLRPDSINDISDFTGLYTSFVDVARADNILDALDSREASVVEANDGKSLARELINE